VNLARANAQRLTLDKVPFGGRHRSGLNQQKYSFVVLPPGS